MGGGEGAGQGASDWQLAFGAATRWAQGAANMCRPDSCHSRGVCVGGGCRHKCVQARGMGFRLAWHGFQHRRLALALPSLDEKLELSSSAMGTFVLCVCVLQ